MRVAICATTYRRPEGLARLLRSLDALRQGPEGVAREIIVVDNDPDGSASPVIAMAQESMDVPLRAVREPHPGIPAARNRALAEALDTQADWIAFLDDDEVAEPEWLVALLRVQAEHDADVVTGPVLRTFEETPPAWIVRGRFFEPRRHATGTRLDRAFTGNMIMRRAVVEAMTPAFDERLQFVGGSDSHFSQRMARAGFKIVWADEAVVREHVPPVRTTVAWLVRRLYRVGTSTAWMSKDLEPGPATFGMTTAKALVWIAIATPLVLGGWIAGRHRSVQGLRFAAYGFGLLTGLFGVRYEEYRRSPSSSS